MGIGASAGGLEAVTQLLKELPASTGMTFVLVQHLDPNHPSELVSLLATQTSMPVLQAMDGLTVEPNHFYVIPPNTQMTIRSGVLRLSPRASKDGPFLSIDSFFRSLAEDRQSRAVGVILSGTGTDGTLGLEAIKGEGGITFAQDATAQFDSMPRSAASAGVVDFVLPPGEIARELAAVAQSFYFGASGAVALPEDGHTLERILSLLRDEAGVDFTHYKTPTIYRRLARRLALHHLDSLEAYLDLLNRNPGEMQALFDDVLITVTEFFRDPEVFDVLADKILPVIVQQRKSTEPIRVWVSACSSGKEAYSIAIVLLEFMEAKRLKFPIQIFGTDLSERSIEIARAGRYPENIQAFVSPERLRRFFHKRDGNYLVSERVRELCIFSRHDVTRDPPLANMDLISCRNLLIYLEPVLQRRVLAIFSYALRQQGFLLLGTSETPIALSEHFDVVDPRYKVYSRNLNAVTSGLELPLRMPRLRAAASALPAARIDQATALDARVDKLMLARYAPAGLLLNSQWQVMKFRGEVGPYLAPSPGDPVLDALGLVHPDLAVLLKSGLEEAGKKDSVVRKEGVQWRHDGRLDRLNLEIRPIADPDTERHFLVMFENAAQPSVRPQTQAGNAGPKAAEDRALELESTRSYMQRLIEELRSANEEAQSVNEELQSTNEELQTAREELQSSNEELHTTIEELQSRNRELNQVNNDLINVLSSMQAPIILLDRDLQIRRYTPVSEKLFSLIPADVGRPISDLQRRIKVPDLETLLTQVIASGQPLEREVQDLDGHWHSLRIQPYRTSDDQIDGVLFEFLDIDRLKYTLAQVERARDYAEAIISTVREPLLVLDRELRVRTANRSFYETFRVSAEETLNRSIYELGSRQWDAPKVRALLGSLQGSGETRQEIEVERDFPGLGWRTFQLTARSVDSDREEKLILLALEDYSDRKRAAEAKYRRLFETSKDAIVMIDAETGEITDVNPSVLEVFGYTRGELTGKPFWQAPPLDRIPGGQSALERLRREEVTRFPQGALTAKDGRSIETDIIGNMYREGDKRVIQLNIRDITERVQFERQLQHVAKLESLGVLAGGIAHDFNNLLTAIMGNASLALTAAPADTPYQQALKEVVQASHRAADLTRQMLAYAGKGRFVIRPIDLSELVRDISALLRSSVPKSIEMKLNLDKNLPAVEADAGQIQQIVMNLAINGAEAIGKENRGVVTISTSREVLDEERIQREFVGEDVTPGVYVCLEVSDTGCGMDAETQARIFDPFFSTKFVGRGLGLAAVLGIMRGHRGAIRITSAPGRGSIFRVLLPASAARTEAPPEMGKKPGPKGSGLVLVVDDEAHVRRLSKAALESHGYQVLTAPDGESSIGVVQERGHELKLVIVDLTMPGIGGPETVARIKSINAGLPVILASGFDAARAMKDFGENDLAGFLQKPFTVEKLLEIVTAVLQPA
ncbi:MAG TPA: chemotaxis protein CheB [Bryobacteraceae bacterium]|nr:chemotaxis protein CheB [Bryobacteraceae bacterium]